ncbi:MAG: LysR family transcriptional regulator [Niallia sp.]
MNLHGLRLFYHVAKDRSFTKAAELLRISQPAVSSQIKQFEKEMGIPLFIKDGKKFKLTEFGSALAEKAEILFSYEEKLDDFVIDYHLSRKGRLAITATYLPANFVIPACAAVFKAENEEIELNLTTTNSHGAFDQLIHHKADIAMYAGGLVEQYGENILSEELVEDEIWFVVSANHRLANKRVTLSEIVKEPFIMREKGSSTRERLFSLCQTYQVLPPKIALQFNGINEAIHSVLTGYGINFVSSLVVRDYIKNKKLARVYVEDIKVTNKIAICTRRNEKRSVMVEKFLDICRKYVKDEY